MRRIGLGFFWLVVFACVFFSAALMVKSLVIVHASSGKGASEAALKAQLYVSAGSGLLTVLIAGGTTWYARLTWHLTEVARASQISVNSQLQVSKRQLTLANRPLLADIGNDSVYPEFAVDLRGSRGHVIASGKGVDLPPANRRFAYLGVALRNIGVAPASLGVPELSVENSTQLCRGRISQAVLPTGERAWVWFEVSREAEDLSDVADALVSKRGAKISLPYSDVYLSDKLLLELILDHGGDAAAGEPPVVTAVSNLELPP